MRRVALVFMLRKSDVFVVFVGDDANIHRGNSAMVMSDEVGERYIPHADSVHILCGL